MTNDAPIFQSVFGKSWDALPAVMHKHYANRPFSNDVHVVIGKMDVTYNWFSKLFAPLFQLFGTLVPYQGQDVPVQVRFLSSPDDGAFYFEREFRFPDVAPYYFRSKMVPIGGNEVIEWTQSRIGWHCSFDFDGQYVRLQHKGYVFRIFGKAVPLPLGLIFGKANAEEEALSDTSFRMLMTIHHPLWGKIYEYRGVFEIAK